MFNQLQELTNSSPQDALTMVNQELQTQPDNHNLLYLKSEILEKLGDTEGCQQARDAAQKAYEEELERNSTDLPSSFQTERLTVFEVDVVPRDTNVSRRIYFAFVTDDESTYPVCTLTVWLNCPMIGPDVEMIQTHDWYSGLGYAEELRKGVEAELGEPLHHEIMDEVEQES